MIRLTILPILFSSIFIASCNEIGNEVDIQINDIKNKTLSTDSIIKDKIDKATNVDTIIKKETDKIKNLDNVFN